MTETSLKIKPQKEIVKPNPNRLKEELAVSQVRDPYYTHGKIERCEQRIRESKEIQPRNKQLFLTFVKWLRSDATAVRSESRVLKYYRHFWLILRLCEKDMEEMTRQDVEELLDKIRSERIYGGKSYSPATYADFLRLIKIFWKWMKTVAPFMIGYGLKKIAKLLLIFFSMLVAFVSIPLAYLSPPSIDS